MKKIISLITLAIACSAQTQAQTSAEEINTIITCQQEDGDQWIEVGITHDDGAGLRALVVLHNVDDESSKLIDDKNVTAISKDDEIIYQDSQKTFKLSVYKKPAHTLKADFSDKIKNVGSLNQEGLLCYEKNSIVFDK